MRKLLIGLLLLATAQITAQETGSIVGKLTDTDFNNDPLAFANILIEGTTKGTTSDFDGLYEIANLDPGTYTVVYSFLGYETITKADVVVEAGKSTTVDVGLSAAAGVELEEFVGTGTTKKESEAALLLDQKNATIVKESIGAQELSFKGISDAAAAVNKISGVSKQEGGGNVYVRGLGDRYLNTTYNGLPVPSNNIEKKNIDLNLFSSDVIQNVGVSKTHAANFYGDFAAGNVDITAKEHTGDFFLDVDLGTTVNTNAVGTDFVKSEGTGYFGFYNRYRNNPYAVLLSHGVDAISSEGNTGVSGSFASGKSWNIGDASRLSVFATASFGNSFEFREGPAVDYTTVEKKRFPNSEQYEYGRNTTAMANIVYRINDKHKVKYNSLFINDATDEVSYFGTKGLGSNRDAILDTDRGFYQSNVQFSQDMIFVNQLLGTSTLSEKLKLDWGVGYNNVLARQPDRKRISVERYDLELDNDESTNGFFFSNIAYDNQRYFQDIEDSELNARINLSYDISEKLKFNFGYNGRSKQRTFENIRYGYDFIQPNTPVGDVRNLDGVFTQENLGTVFNTVVFNGLDPQNGLGNTNLPGRFENTYEGNLNVHAFYTDAVYKISDKLSFVPGIRLEKFNQDITYDVINLPATDPGARDASEFFILPSLNVKYALNEDQNLRFSFSSTVSNPEFKEVAPFVYEDVTQRIGGNPNLLNDPAFSRIYNVDIKYEWFMKPSELLSVAAFAKAINDPVNLVVANDATGTQRFFRTGDQAQVLGFEFEVRKALITDADEQSVLSTGINATYTYTKQDLKGSNGVFSTTFDRESDQLQGASPLLLNADLSYRPTFGSYKPVANLVFSYFSDRIDALGSGQLGNIIEKAVPTLDFVWKNNINEKMELNASFKNLLNPTIERVREVEGGDVTLSSFKRGLNIGFQFKYKF
ncbi:TonB-dependent receptor [Maribacter algarum]|uniref:TonB-dependent receptor n=1 Tax=Maribacter algarum (ex Zhang et al. 2020) TaxID=2578118 RepID=A0A5S3PUU0_9FLAO|nr:TonB-dependent receptor [Maribacter algarum]TMM58710.1 TonB-dependent receptor [Maribacter algarum]